MNPKVDFYFNKGQWQKETEQLRRIALSCGLVEELKWGCPCYVLPTALTHSESEGNRAPAFKTRNIVLIHVFKEYCAYLFFKGALLNDSEGILVQQTENVQGARQIRFTAVGQVIELEGVLKPYIFEAIEVEKAGLKVELKKTVEFTMPEEFQERLSGEGGAILKNAFESLTPGRQRAYLLHFSQAKQSKTRVARIEKWIPQILKGKGLDD